MEKAPRVPQGVRYGQGGYEGKRADDAQGWSWERPAELLSLPRRARPVCASGL